MYPLSRRDRNLKSCQVMVSDKASLLLKVDLPLKSHFQVIALFVLLQMSTKIIFGTSQNNVSLYLWNIHLIADYYGHVALLIFQIRIPHVKIRKGGKLCLI